MKQFERWRAWCSELNDEDRAALWLGMGIVAARTNPWGRFLLDEVGFGFAAETLETATSRAQMGTDRVNWRPPFGRHHPKYPDLHPFEWVQLIRSAFGNRLRPAGDPYSRQPSLRLRLRLHYTESPATARLYQDLLLGGPWAVAPTLSLDLRRPVFRWPLRLAHLDPVAPAAYTNARENHWTTEHLSEVYALDRGRSNCDLLWFTGTFRDLVQTLTARNYNCKANIVVLQNDQEEWSEEERALAAKMLQASVFVALRRNEGPREQGRRLNNFMKEFSHDALLDVALTSAFQDVAWIWASDDAANFHLTKIAENLEAALQALPDTAIQEVSQLRGIVVLGRTDVPEFQLRARDLKLDVGSLIFDQEIHGASDLAAVATAIAAAAETQSAKEISDRQIQLDTYLHGRRSEKAVHGFPMGALATVAIRIGLPDDRYKSATGAPREFAQGNEFSNLTVWLTEPDQLDAPMRRTLRLPAFGSSEFCEFSFYPKEPGLFDGRISVLHRGRVLQTARLLAGIPPTRADGGPDGAPRFDELYSVRQNMADLGRRRNFDLSIVTNHTAASEPRMVALSANRAWIADSSAVKAPIKAINVLLSEVAGRSKNYVNGLDGESGRDFLVQLARRGAELHLALVGEQLSRPTNNRTIADQEYIQIVSTRSDGVIPFEFVYSFTPPLASAKLCPSWRSGIATGACAATCELHTVPKHNSHVCPLGFWGQQKVIERHLYSPEHAADGKDLFLQSEPGRATSELALKGSVVVASSKNVDDKGRDLVVSALAPFTFVKAALVKNWAEWKAAVISNKPPLILSMPHADVALGEVSLEIGGVPMATMDIDTDYVRPDGSATSPIVVLLGCDTAEAIEDYSRHIQWIRSRGAAVVVATISTVAGLQAPVAAALLARSIFNREGTPFFLGEAIRTMRREALLANELIALALVAYGDADWKIKVGG